MGDRFQTGDRLAILRETMDSRDQIMGDRFQTVVDRGRPLGVTMGDRGRPLGETMVDRFQTGNRLATLRE